MDCWERVSRDIYLEALADIIARDIGDSCEDWKAETDRRSLSYLARSGRLNFLITSHHKIFKYIHTLSLKYYKMSILSNNLFLTSIKHVIYLLTGYLTLDSHSCNESYIICGRTRKPGSAKTIWTYCMHSGALRSGKGWWSWWVPQDTLWSWPHSVNVKLS